MDMKCQKCLEPWDWWYIRDEVLENEDDFQKMMKEGGMFDDGEGKEAGPNWQFAPGPHIKQCPACFGQKVKLTERQEFEAMAQSALADILGDDIDGLMAEIEDIFG